MAGGVILLNEDPEPFFNPPPECPEKNTPVQISRQKKRKNRKTSNGVLITSIHARPKNVRPLVGEPLSEKGFIPVRFHYASLPLKHACRLFGWRGQVSAKLKKQTLWLGSESGHTGDGGDPRGRGRHHVGDPVCGHPAAWRSNLRRRIHAAVALLVHPICV